MSRGRFLHVTYCLSNGHKDHFQKAMSGAKSLVLGGLGPSFPKCNDITLNHPELPLPSRFCLLSLRNEYGWFWEIIDLVPKSRWNSYPERARCFLNKGNNRILSVGYEPLKVETDDQIIIQFHPNKNATESKISCIELKVDDNDNDNATVLPSYVIRPINCDHGIKSEHPDVYTPSSLINDLQREAQLPENICGQLYCVFSLLRKQMTDKKTTIFKQDHGETNLHTEIRKLDTEIRRNYHDVPNRLFEQGSKKNILKENTVKVLSQDITSFFRFIMRIFILYDLGSVRTRIIQWAGWKSGMPLFITDKGGRVDNSDQGKSDNKQSDTMRCVSLTYERKNLKYLDKYPHDVLNQFGIIPLTSSIRQDRIYWAVLDPFDLGWRVFLNALRQPNEAEYLNIIDIVDYDELMKEMGKRQDARRAPEIDPSMDDGSQGLQYETIPPRMQKLLQDAQDQKASDIHIEADEDKSVVRFRVDGVLHNYAEFNKEAHNAIVSHFKVRTNMDVTEKRRPQDGRLTLSGTDIRASTYPTVKGEKFVLRLLDQESIVRSIDHLGMLPFDLQFLRTNINSPNGLILICGPTGSGKTTTLYACLSELNKPDSNIMTIEEPVEYQLHGINQMQVRADIDLTFERGLRTILRQDPDIIMVGEIRDQNTARTAIQAAMTGHLVLSTIHTNSAPQAVSRLLEMGVEPYMITSALNLTVAQRLVRRVCPSCRKLTSGAQIREHIESAGFDYQSFTRTFGMEIPLNDNFFSADPNGCQQCFSRGYRGRMAIFETFNMNRLVRDQVHNNVTDVEELWLSSRGVKWQEKTLWAHARHLLMRKGVTTFEEIIRVMGL
ncbi:MAG: type II/IV secretion system protein [Magnetococcales bacterium]|nr:type II/IV secretion system protein [Magnetococcales bacterium]